MPINPDLPRNPNPPDGESSIIIYNYIPSLALGVCGVVLFGLIFLAHSFHFFRHKKGSTRTFHALLAFGCLMEIVGYVFRLLSHGNPFVVVYFIIQYFMIVCAPIFFTAALYLALSITSTRTPLASFLPLRPKLILLIFIIADVVTILVQVAGAALIGVAESGRANGETTSISSEQANNILLAGLAVQNGSFLIFLAILGVTILRVGRAKEHGGEKEGQVKRKPLLVLLGVLALTSLLVFWRTLFRLGETAEGVLGPASSSEALFGGLEFLPVVLATGLWALLPLENLLRRAASVV